MSIKREQEGDKKGSPSSVGTEVLAAKSAPPGGKKVAAVRSDQYHKGAGLCLFKEFRKIVQTILDGT
jgi:hypothetical protein